MRNLISKTRNQIEKKKKIWIEDAKQIKEGTWGSERLNKHQPRQVTLFPYRSSSGKEQWSQDFTFRDDSNPSPYDFTAVTRAIAFYLEERLDCFVTGKFQRRDLLTKRGRTATQEAAGLTNNPFET
ncbi:putative clathrin assembly protein [Corchorus olitorius]|uniref:Clathrin assembly protein n=1 Tax=Corchorus olitorius TaxID=93759 RepID=A0A1R3G5J2_9ROSI|nr:putative clathrin assembly protein [Corchorus olitorius]